jgi:hypothetical protein
MKTSKTANGLEINVDYTYITDSHVVILLFVTLLMHIRNKRLELIIIKQILLMVQYLK